MMDTPENYYAILGVPIDADANTIKRAYRQKARRFHPDLAGPAGSVEMKRINRAYDVLSDAEKRRDYDTIIGGIIDLRGGRFAQSVVRRPRPSNGEFSDDFEFDGLRIFATKGPFHIGPVIHSDLGVISSLNSTRTVEGELVAAGSLDGKGALWRLQNDTVGTPVSFAANPSYTVESLRELRLSPGGALLAGWGRLSLYTWDAYDGTLLWSYGLEQRAVSAHYSLDLTFESTPEQWRHVRMALPLLGEDPRAPRALGVRGTDVVTHVIGAEEASLIDPLVCPEEEPGNRQFWAIRLRALSQDARTLATLSCARVPHESNEVAIVRSWDLYARTRLGKVRPQIIRSILVGSCAECAAPYVATPDARMLAFVYSGRKIRICDTREGTYSELASGLMGGSSRLALSPDATWAAVAREDSEANEGVVDLWSVTTGQIEQKLYHPWQISAMHFTDKQLLVALTDGTIQMWK